MTELQKLSLKKLRKKRLPLFVIDQKSKRRVFVIADAETYQDKAPPKEPQKRPLLSSRKAAKSRRISDYRLRPRKRNSKPILFENVRLDSPEDIHVEPPAPDVLGKADWKDLQLFFQKFQKECLELIRP